VSSTGLVSGVAAGQATIALTVEGKVGTSAIVVQVAQPSIPPVGSVSFLPSSVNVRRGGDVIVAVIVLDVNGRAAAGRTCDLSSSDDSRATVTPAQVTTGSTGIFLPRITGVRRRGSSPVNITALCGGVSDRLRVTVQ
jgi:hypothetical protein